MTNMTFVRKSPPSRLTAGVEAALIETMLKPDIDTNAGIYALEGMSGKRYRYFINVLVRALENPRYLEIGSWAGSTLCSAIAGNLLTAVAIDNWSEFGGPKDTFMRNVRAFVRTGAKVMFLEADFRKVDFNQMGEGFNVYLFDGPHGAQDHYDGLALALPSLDDEFVFIVDDWNWLTVRAGTFAAIDKCGLKVHYAAEIRTSLDNTQPALVGKQSDWHNGYFISVLAKTSRASRRAGPGAAKGTVRGTLREKRSTTKKSKSKSASS